MERINEILERRKEIYSLLSSLFLGEIPEKFIEDLLNENFWIPGSKDAEEGIRIMREFVEKRNSVEEAIKDIEDEYSRLILFSYSLPLTKSEFLGEGEYGNVSLEVEEKIRKMGYRLKSNVLPPDHISAQFDFIVTLIESSFEEEGNLKESLEKQEEFLENEIITWIPDALSRLEDVNGFYRGVAKFARGFLSIDRNVVKELKLW